MYTHLNDVMKMSDKEAETFWPLYHEYEIELFEIGDRRLELIERFVAAHQGKGLDDSEAKAMASDWFKLSTDRIGLLKKYHDLIAQRLSPVRAILFAQIENRINMVIDIMIASELPLFKYGEAPAATNVGTSSPSPLAVPLPELSSAASLATVMTLRPVMKRVQDSVEKMNSEHRTLDVERRM